MSLWRQRRASIRKISTVEIPRTAYKATMALSVATTPPLVVAAAAVVCSW